MITHDLVTEQTDHTDCRNICAWHARVDNRGTVVLYRAVADTLSTWKI